MTKPIIVVKYTINYCSYVCHSGDQSVDLKTVNNSDEQFKGKLQNLIKVIIQYIPVRFVILVAVQHGTCYSTHACKQ